MSARLIGASVLAVALAAAWFYRDTAPVARAVRAVDGLSVPAPPPSLQSAGVHKCVSEAGTSYLDHPCPRGSREQAATGGTMTVTSFPKPAPAPSLSASGLLGGPIITPMDPAERDRLRDKQLEDAANRP